jgi:uncharacterized membrane protein required for colicin V production
MEVVKDYFTRLNWVDIFFVICLIRAGYIGFSRGFTSEIPRIICAFLTVVLAYQFYGRLGLFLSKYPIVKAEAVDALAFILLVAGFAVLSFFACMGYRIIMKASGPHMFEVIAGLVVGLVRGILISSLILVCVEFMAPGYVERSINEASIVGLKLIKIAPGTYEFVSNLVKNGQ